MVNNQSFKNQDNGDSTVLLKDEDVIQRILNHIDNKSTDIGDQTWLEPSENYRSKQRFSSELMAIRQQFTVYCPSSALNENGAFIARDVFGIPIIVARNSDGEIKAFKNACRHRGVKVAEGCGRTKAFVCPYHAWTYDLDGNLKVVPHEHGFPDIEKSQRGLVPIKCVESDGLVFVCVQGEEQTPDKHLLANIPNIIPNDYQVYQELSIELQANWKIVLESFLEGYHIRSTHTRTFYPIQYDNLNVVEKFGRHNRLTFPYRSIEKLRDKPVNQWSIESCITYVYHLFPNILISNHPGFKTIVILEPLENDRTKQVTYVVTNLDTNIPEKKAFVDGALDIVNKGLEEDRHVIRLGQLGLATQANEHLEFGLFESAIVNFHSTMSGLLKPK